MEKIEGIIQAIEAESKTPSPSHLNLARLVAMAFRALLEPRPMPAEEPQPVEPVEVAPAAPAPEPEPVVEKPAKSRKHKNK